MIDNDPHPSNKNIFSASKHGFFKYGVYCTNKYTAKESQSGLSANAPIAFACSAIAAHSGWGTFEAEGVAFTKSNEIFDRWRLQLSLGKTQKARIANARTCAIDLLKTNTCVKKAVDKARQNDNAVDAVDAIRQSLPSHIQSLNSLEMLKKGFLSINNENLDTNDFLERHKEKICELSQLIEKLESGKTTIEENNLLAIILKLYIKNQK